MEQLCCDGTESLDPEIWSELPYDMVREILGHVDDIDTSRAFGIKPRKLPKSDFKIKPLNWGSIFPGIWYCFDDKGKVLKYVDGKGNSVYMCSQQFSFFEET